MSNIFIFYRICIQAIHPSSYHVFLAIAFAKLCELVLSLPVWKLPSPSQTVFSLCQTRQAHSRTLSHRANKVSCLECYLGSPSFSLKFKGGLGFSVQHTLRPYCSRIVPVIQEEVRIYFRIRRQTWYLSQASQAALV